MEAFKIELSFLGRAWKFATTEHRDALLADMFVGYQEEGGTEQEFQFVAVFILAALRDIAESIDMAWCSSTEEEEGQEWMEVPSPVSSILFDELGLPLDWSVVEEHYEHLHDAAALIQEHYDGLELSLSCSLADEEAALEQHLRERKRSKFWGEGDRSAVSQSAKRSRFSSPLSPCTSQIDLDSKNPGADDLLRPRQRYLEAADGKIKLAVCDGWGC